MHRYCGLCFQLRAGEQHRVWAKGGRYDQELGRMLAAEGVPVGHGVDGLGHGGRAKGGAPKAIGSVQ